MNTNKSFDIIIIGAGPAGLSCARALADTGLKICLVERQSLEVLKNPPLDGRDIALTHDSMHLMRELDMLKYISKNEISPIREAKVFSGESFYFLGFDTKGTNKSELGYLVPNNEIRKAAYKAASSCANVTIKDERLVTKVETNEREGSVHLSKGEILRAPLIVAADSRFSAARKQMGIAVSSVDFGRSAIVCRMTHDLPHGEVAQECFFDDWTLAILPLQGKKSSIVITLPSDQVEETLALTPKDFNARIEQSLSTRLGSMRLIGERYTYPLVAIYAGNFAGTRFALMGDAAVGMHPVTAHGYNLGLQGAHILVEEIRKALSLGIDIGAASVLESYAQAHRRASALLYYGTNMMVKFYTDNRPASLMLRDLGLRIANHLPVLKKYVRRQLTGRAA